MLWLRLEDGIGKEERGKGGKMNHLQLAEALSRLETASSPEDLLRRLNYVIPILEYTLNNLKKRRRWVWKGLKRYAPN